MAGAAFCVSNGSSGGPHPSSPASAPSEAAVEVQVRSLEARSPLRSSSRVASRPPPKPRRLGGLRGHSGAGSLGHSLCYHVGEKFPTLRWCLPPVPHSGAEVRTSAPARFFIACSGNPPSGGLLPPPPPPAPRPVTLL